MTAAQAEAALAEQSIEAAAVEQRNVDRQLGALAQRRERLAEEQASSARPMKRSSPRLQAATRASTRARWRPAPSAQQRSRCERRSDDRRSGSSAGRRGARQSEALARLEAHLQALKQVQASVEAKAKLDPWLRAQGLESLPRLFRKLVVEPGWETAFEAVLRERVQGVEVGRLDTIGGLAADAPPSRVAFYSTSGAIPSDARNFPQWLDSAPQRVWCVRTMPRLPRCSPTGSPGVYVADDLAAALAARGELPPGGQFVVQAAHRVSRHDVHFYAPDDQTAGLLARRLGDREPRARSTCATVIPNRQPRRLARAEAELRSAQQARDAARQDGGSAQSANAHAAARIGSSRRIDRSQSGIAPVRSKPSCTRSKPTSAKLRRSVSRRCAVRAARRRVWHRARRR